MGIFVLISLCKVVTIFNTYSQKEAKEAFLISGQILQFQISGFNFHSLASTYSLLFVTAFYLFISFLFQ